MRIVVFMFRELSDLHSADGDEDATAELPQAKTQQRSAPGQREDRQSIKIPPPTSSSFTCSVSISALTLC